MASFLDLLTNPTTLGLGLNVAGGLLDREPGEVLEARQALRNQFNSPYSALLPDFSGTGVDFLRGQVTAPSDPFATGGAYARYLPALQRSESDLLDALQTRYRAAFPAGLGMQGSEAEALRRAGSEFAIGRQSLQADLLREQQTRQENAARSLLQYGLSLPTLQQGAARSVLEFSRPDPTANALANLGTVMAYTSLMNRQPGVSIFNQAPGATAGKSLTGNPKVDAQIGSAINSALTAASSQGFGAVSALLASQIPVLGISVGSAISALGAAGLGIWGGKELGQSVFGRTPESERAGNLGGGLGSALGAILGTFVAPGPGTAIGAGLGGAAGSVVGTGAKQPDISSRETFQGALGGLFGPLGAYFAAQGDVSSGEALRDAFVTSLATAVGGFGGGIFTSAILGKQRGAELEKARFRTQDVDSQRDQVFEIGNVGAELLLRAKVPQSVMDQFQSFVESSASRVEGGGNEQGEVASEMNRLLTAAGYPAGQRPPEWRQYWIDYLIANTFTSGNSIYGGGAPLNFIRGEVPGWLNLAQLKYGGYANRPMLALVGEEGPELAYLPTGAAVLPLRN